MEARASISMFQSRSDSKIGSFNGCLSTWKILTLQFSAPFRGFMIFNVFSFLYFFSCQAFKKNYLKDFYNLFYCSLSYVKDII